MVLNASRWLLLAAVLAAGAPIIAEAHRPPAPFRALDGGELKRAGPLRVELLRDDSSLQLVFRDHWNDPAAVRELRVTAWTGSGLVALPFELRGYRARVTPADLVEGRLLVEFRDPHGTLHKLIFPASAGHGASQ